MQLHCNSYRFCSMERDFCILIHTVRIQTTVSLYSSSPDSYRNRDSFYHVIIPSTQWSWRWVCCFHLVCPSVRLRIILHVFLRIMAGMRRIGNAEIFSALWLKCGYNAEISPYSCPNTPIRIFSAFPQHFFPYKNAEISPRSSANTPIRISSTFFSAFFSIKECGDYSAFLSEYSLAEKMRRSGVWV